MTSRICSWNWLMPLLPSVAEKKTSRSLDLLKSDNIHTAHALNTASCWIVDLSQLYCQRWCGDSQDLSENRYMICCWLPNCKFSFTTFMHCQPENQGAHHTSVNNLLKWHFGCWFLLWFVVWRHQGPFTALCLQHSPRSKNGTYQGKSSTLPGSISQI